jgi:hypothetical protein
MPAIVACRLIRRTKAFFSRLTETLCDTGIAIKHKFSAPIVSVIAPAFATACDGNRHAATPVFHDARRSSNEAVGAIAAPPNICRRF